MSGGEEDGLTVPKKPPGCSGAGTAGSGWRWPLPDGEHGVL